MRPAVSRGEGGQDAAGIEWCIFSGAKSHKLEKCGKHWKIDFFFGMWQSNHLSVMWSYVDPCVRSIFDLRLHTKLGINSRFKYTTWRVQYLILVHYSVRSRAYKGVIGTLLFPPVSHAAPKTPMRAPITPVAQPLLSMSHSCTGDWLHKPGNPHNNNEGFLWWGKYLRSKTNNFFGGKKR